MVRTIFVFGIQTWRNFLQHNGTLQAAAISYYILFSFVPMLILVGGVLGFVITDDARRQNIEDKILDAIPLSRTEGRDTVEEAMNTLENVRGPALVIGLAGTLWAASAAFSAIRRSLNAVWGIYERRPFLTSKLVDFAQLGFLGVIIVVSFLITGVITFVRQATIDRFSFLNDSILWEIPGAVVPLMMIFIAMLLLYRYVPVAHPSWREVVVPSALASLAIWILSNGFAFYVTNFSNFDAVYGALAGVFLFLLFMNLIANILLIGGELSRTFHRYGLGELEALIHPTGPPESVVQQTLRLVKGMFVRQP